MIEKLINFIETGIPHWVIQLVAFMISCAIVIAGLVLIIWLIKTILAIRWKTLTQWLPFYIKNDGNLPCRFKLSAFSLEPGLDLYLGDGQLPLPVIKVPIVNAVSLPVRAGSSSQSTPKPVTPAAQAPSTGTIKDDAGKAKAKAEKGLGKMKLAGTILGTLGGLLPGSAGAELKKSSTAVQSQAQSASATMKMPEEKMTAIKTLQGQTKNLASIPQATVGQSNEPVAVVTPNTIAATTSEQPDSHHKPESQFFDIYNVTPVVDSHSTLELVLQVEPRQRYGSRPFNCWVTIIPWVESPPDGLTLPGAQIIKKKIQTKGYAPFFAFVSLLMILAVLSINGLWMYLTIRWLASLVA